MPKSIQTFLVVAVLTFCLASRAASFVWDGGGGDSNWHNPANWAPDGVPGAGDDAEVKQAVAIEVSSSTTINRFVVRQATRPHGLVAQPR